jgi:hypothetical protein
MGGESAFGWPPKQAGARGQITRHEFRIREERALSCCTEWTWKAELTTLECNGNRWFAARCSGV